MLRKILESRIAEKQLSNRAAATEIGIAHTTLNRILEGGQIELDTILKIATWSGIPPATLMGIETGDNDVNLLIAAIPGLKEVLSEAAEKVKSGELDVSALADITAYARFRVLEKDDRSKRKNT